MQLLRLNHPRPTLLRYKMGVLFIAIKWQKAVEVAENDELNELEELWYRLQLVSNDLEFHPTLQDYLSIDDRMDANENGPPQLEALPEFQ
uniref:Uncharacterized protein n=1 Tax=Acrobeloides nanus TaxID=290746 RepID=A0A914D5L3_9BILA